MDLAIANELENHKDFETNINRLLTVLIRITHFFFAGNYKDSLKIGEKIDKLLIQDILDENNANQIKWAIYYYNRLSFNYIYLLEFLD